MTTRQRGSVGVGRVCREEVQRLGGDCRGAHHPEGRWRSFQWPMKVRTKSSNTALRAGSKKLAPRSASSSRTDPGEVAFARASASSCCLVVPQTISSRRAETRYRKELRVKA